MEKILKAAKDLELLEPPIMTWSAKSSYNIMEFKQGIMNEVTLNASSPKTKGITIIITISTTTITTTISQIRQVD